MTALTPRKNESARSEGALAAWVKPQRVTAIAKARATTPVNNRSVFRLNRAPMRASASATAITTSYTTHAKSSGPPARS